MTPTHSTVQHFTKYILSLLLKITADSCFVSATVTCGWCRSDVSLSGVCNYPVRNVMSSGNKKKIKLFFLLILCSNQQNSGSVCQQGLCFVEHCWDDFLISCTCCTLLWHTHGALPGSAWLYEDAVVPTAVFMTRMSLLRHLLLVKIFCVYTHMYTCTV